MNNIELRAGDHEREIAAALLEAFEAGRKAEADDADRARLHEALERSGEQFARGEGIPADEVLSKIRDKK